MASSQEAPKQVPWPVHAARQLKFVIPGGLATYYIGVLEEFGRTLLGYNGSVAKTGAMTAGGLGLTTVALLLYVISLYYTAAEPDFRSWRDSSPLRRVITVRTAASSFQTSSEYIPLDDDRVNCAWLACCGGNIGAMVEAGVSAKRDRSDRSVRTDDGPSWPYSRAQNKAESMNMNCNLVDGGVRSLFSPGPAAC
ncbi:hypothetical protein NMY22_g5364 [Coprinellus aureogranulatus]|nr:hypothetical protein NMY22_g5364 [Coprinellus aureogranulatus]